MKGRSIYCHQGCKACEEHKEHRLWRRLPSEEMGFYHIMMGDFSEFLTIPKNFMDNLRGEISEIAELKSPSGSIWQVGLTKSGEKTVMQFGWKEFVKAHHIEEGDLLAFNYDGDSCFKVSVYGGSHCKKAAAYFVSSRKGSAKLRERRVDSVEISEQRSQTEVVLSDSLSIQEEQLPINRKLPRRSRRGATNNRRAVSRGTKRKTRSNVIPVQLKKKRGRPFKKVGPLKGTECNIKQEPDDMHNCGNLADYQNLCLPSKKKLTSEEQKRILHLVQSVESNNPCFASIMQPSNLHKGRFLAIPSAFARVHLPSQSSEMFLQIKGQGRKWCVSYLVGRVVSGICKQWKCFAQDNDLEVGDICLFQLKENQEDVELAVHIDRIADQVHPL